MSKTKYCVAKSHPKWQKVFYPDAANNMFIVDRSIGCKCLDLCIMAVDDSTVSRYIRVPLDDMQDLIDSMQAFYDQEKEKG